MIFLLFSVLSLVQPYDAFLFGLEIKWPPQSYLPYKGFAICYFFFILEITTPLQTFTLSYLDCYYF